MKTNFVLYFFKTLLPDINTYPKVHKNFFLFASSLILLSFGEGLGVRWQKVWRGPLNAHLLFRFCSFLHRICIHINGDITWIVYTGR